jgi:hypothetical protein
MYSLHELLNPMHHCYSAFDIYYHESKQEKQSNAIKFDLIYIYNYIDSCNLILELQRQATAHYQDKRHST